MSDLIQKSITTVQLDKNDIKRLSSELIEDLVSNESSPFGFIKQILDEKLSDVGLDNKQKVAVITTFLKDAYTSITQQVLNAALKYAETNAQLKLETYKTEAEYNRALAEIKRLNEESLSIAKNNVLRDKEIKLANKKLEIEELNKTEVAARLKKQWGVQTAVQYSFNTGSDKYAPVLDANTGLTMFYKVNDEGKFVKSDGTTTTDPINEGVKLADSNMTFTITHQNTAEPSAIDKQIEGYDKVNYKDIIRTLNELNSMMVNAQTDVPKWLPDTVKTLIAKTTGVNIG